MKKQDFNCGWQVHKDGEDAVVQVNLPHDAMISEPRSKEHKTGGSGAYFSGGKYIYTKTFDVPESWTDQTALLEFEGVYQNAMVLVNGKTAVERPYGYTDFTVELDPFLNYGTTNTIEVIADNSKCPNSRWYTGSGIYRPVSLYTAPKCHIKKDGVQITTPDLKTAMVAVETANCESGTVKVEIRDGNTSVACETVPVSNGKANITFTLPDPKVWSADKPNLYTCHVALEAGGAEVDTEDVCFGIRTLSWSTKGFQVNGEEICLRGGCIHHDNGILGACTFADAEERRVRIMKEAGFNAIRSSHNPMSKAMLDACDRLGMYVMDESFDQWLVHKNPYDYGNETFRQWWKKDTEAMIVKDRNHPCVLMYSIGNEISELGTAEGQELAGEMAAFVKAADPTRAVTAGVNIMLATMASGGKGLYSNEGDKGNGSATMDNVPTSAFFNLLMNKMGGFIERAAVGKKADAATAGAFDKLDIGGYNYAASRYVKDGELFPKRVIVGSETLPKTLYRNWQYVKKLPYLIGDFIWTAWDYLGEAGIGTVKYASEQKKGTLIVSGGAGIIDICGKQRPEVQWGKIIWGLRSEPCIGVDPVTRATDKKGVSMWRDTDAVESWSWEGHSGTKTNVIVYADADVVELQVNGKSCGKKKVKEDKALFKRVAYEDGEVKAIAYDASGKKLSETALKTATGKTRLTLLPETTKLRANGQDLCFLNIELTGSDEIVKSAEDRKITVKVSGAGCLQALGSANPYMAENFHSDSHTTYYGKALAVIRADYQPGEVTVEVSADGLETQKLTITVC